MTVLSGKSGRDRLLNWIRKLYIYRAVKEDPVHRRYFNVFIIDGVADRGVYRPGSADPLIMH